ncbi:MAG: hypothetical protein JWM91_356 [Rhodospirillales bacterium]|nr:hypothetical protein [Rhodospirillales bacterium]
MNGPRAFGFAFLLCLSLAGFFLPDASAQMNGGQMGGGNGGEGSGGMPGRRGQSGGNGHNRQPVPDQSVSPRSSDPEGRDAIELYSRLCVSTRGSRAQAIGIIGDGDSAIEKMTEPMLRGLENGQSGGIGWIIRMPLGDRILVEFAADGTCLVRAPRANTGQIEAAFHGLLDQYAASGQFDVRHGGEQTKSFDTSGRPENPAPRSDERHRDANKLKVHFIYYTMKMPDTGRTAELGLATTDSRSVQVQATLTYATRPPNAGQNSGPNAGIGRP